MTRNLDKRLNRLEGGHSEELLEIAPDLWLTGAQVGEVLKAVDGKTRGIPPKAGDHGQAH